MKKLIFLNIILVFGLIKIAAQTNDTLVTMTYNLLLYGDNCQGDEITQRTYLRKIIHTIQADLAGLVKLYPIQRYPGDFSGYHPHEFIDTLLHSVFDMNGKNFKAATFTNEARGSDINVLFYNANKLTFKQTEVLVVENTDFDLYSFYYNDPNLSTHNDTTFLYVILLHTESGDDASTRNDQIYKLVQKLHWRLSYLPNLIILGDFNTRNSEEDNYYRLTREIDSNFCFYDPPFSVDNKLKYPNYWDKNDSMSIWFTTSTRQFSNQPNSCGTSGGAKDWYDHILFSNWIKNNLNYISYVSNSYQTFGNDGLRKGISINDSTSHGKNLLISSEISNAMYYLSNKYPVISKFIIHSNKTGQSLIDPIWSKTNIQEIQKSNKFYLFNLEKEYFIQSEFSFKIKYSSLFSLNGKTITFKLIQLEDNKYKIILPDLIPGLYFVQILTDEGQNIYLKLLK